MSVRTLHIVRHGAADAWGVLTDQGREQCRLLGRRLAALPLDVIWHSPLERAADSAAVIAGAVPGIYVDEAAELVDHVPHLPDPSTLAPPWSAFFDGYGGAEAAADRRTARALLDRFAAPPAPGARATHEVLVTHAFSVAWLVVNALGAPPSSWLSLTHMANTGLTTIRCEQDQPPTIGMVNDQTHLPAALRWTGYPEGAHP